MIYLIFICAATLMFIGAYTSYTRKDEPYFTAVFMLSGNLLLVTWICLVRSLNTSRQIFTAGFVWDSICTLVYIFVPVMFCGLKIDKWAVLGVLLTVVGLVILRSSE
jgi:hypothetical protein